VALGTLEASGAVPTPLRFEVALDRVNAVLGTELTGDEVASLLEPIGFGAEPAGGAVTVSVPTNRPDVRPSPHGIDDVIEEIGRTYGYSRLPRRQPSWPEPGSLNEHQRRRRAVRQVLCGLGASQAWTPTFLDDAEHARLGLDGPAVQVANPLDQHEAVLRRSLLPGLLGALAFNADRRQASLRLFELGTVFEHPDLGGGRVVERAGAAGGLGAMLPAERELVGVVLALESSDPETPVADDARSAVAAWRVLAEALSVTGVNLVAVDPGAPPAGLHPTRAAQLVNGVGPDAVILGSVGEVDPWVATAFGLPGRRIGYLEVDLALLDTAVAPPSAAVSFSRFPSSDVDLAFVVSDDIPAATVEVTIGKAGGDQLVSVVLFDVYRGEGIAPGARSLAYRLRFVAPDHTMTDEEVGSLRQACIEAVTGTLDAVLR
jgi:phenylalanyl-tRNA synthetase beta chain